MNYPSVTIASANQQATILSLLEENREWLNSKGIKQWIIPFTLEWVSKCIERGEFHIAVVGDQTVGVFRLLESDPTFWGNDSRDSFYIHSLAVRRDWKGQGIGLSLLKWAEEYTRSNQRSYLRLDCMAENFALCAYYEQAGFKSCGVRDIQLGQFVWKAHLYQKDIDQ